MRGHAFAPVLDRPGEQDLTAHVDFQALAQAASDAGAAVTRLLPQGEWLQRLGIAARAERLADLHPQRSGEIQIALQRLCDPARMGSLFKVMSIHAPDWPAPAGFE
jgi:NADH dehydrogenase [ubiquinone] 1 alpha subcomplex assembly factor 7